MFNPFITFFLPLLSSITIKKTMIPPKRKSGGRCGEADRQAALRVSVDQQDFLSDLRQPDSQVGTGRCLANAAFLVGNGNDLRVH